MISNASDAVDKLNFKSLQDGDLEVDKESFKIEVFADKPTRTLIISDNGIGMNEDFQRIILV